MFTKLQIIICLLLLVHQVNSQLPHEKELIQQLTKAKTDEEKVVVLGKLAELYSIYKNNRKADSILDKQILLAELAHQDELMLKTISGKAIDNIGGWSNKETFDHAIQFLQKALNYAKSQDNTYLEAVCHLKLATLFRKRGLFDQAMAQTSLAFPLTDKKQDSLKAALYIELGEAFLSKGEAVSAYKNFNTAYDISYSIKNIPLQSATWHCFSNLYRALGDTILATNSLSESLRLNTKHANAEGLLVDNIDLFRLTDEIDFLNKALYLADTVGSISHQLYGKRLMLSYYMVVEKNSEKALNYLKKNSDLLQYFTNEGLPNFNIGAIYHYSGKYTEAIEHYLLDEAAIVNTFDPFVQLSFFCEVANCYDKTNQNKKAIEYYKKAFAISQNTGSINSNANITSRLSDLFARIGDYENAFRYSNEFQKYNEQLKELAKQKEVTILGLEREKRRHEIDLQAIADEDLRRRNLQYTGISMATAFLFIILIIFGMFPISRLTIRMLNFFSFICLFEFIILLIDNWLHHVTHAEPLKIWLAKIFIIAILLPLHHSLEHIAIKFLSSQKLQRFRRKLSIRHIFHPTKKQVQKLEKTLEESTLV